MIYLIVFLGEALGIIFASAGVMKLVDRFQFAKAISGYRLVPNRFVTPLSWVLPLIELLTGIGLIGAFSPRWPSIVACGLSLLFAFAVAINLARGNRNIACGCFGSSGDDQIGWGIVGRNIGFATTAMTLVFVDTGYFGNVERMLPIAERWVIFCMAAAAVCLWSLGTVIGATSKLTDAA